MAPIHVKTLIAAFPYIMQISTDSETLLYAGKRPNFHIERKHADTAYVYVDSSLVAIVAANTPIKGIEQEDEDLKNYIIEMDRRHGSDVARDKFPFEVIRRIQIKQYNS